MPDAKFPVNDAEWTYDQALVALTEGSFDLRTPTTPTNGWIIFDPNYDKSKNDFWFEAAVGLKYHTYYAAKVNTDALTAWTTAVGNINTAMAEIAGGAYGTMNVVSLNEFMHEVRVLVDWLETRSGEFHKFNTDLNSTDSAFKGTAAFVISDRLKHYGDALADLQKQMTTKNGVGVPDAAAGAQSALSDYGRRMGTVWFGVWKYLSDFPRAHVDWWAERVANYVNTPGLFTGGGYHTSKYYQGRLARFPMPDGTLGDLGSAPTWNLMNQDITNRLKTEIQNFLDKPAQDIMRTLRTAYELDAGAIVPLVAPTMLPTLLPKDDQNGGPPTDGNTPPLPNVGDTPLPGGPNVGDTPLPGGPNVGDPSLPGGPNLADTPFPGGPNVGDPSFPGGPNVGDTPLPGGPASNGNGPLPDGPLPNTNEPFPLVSPFTNQPVPKGSTFSNPPVPKGPTFSNPPVAKGPDFTNQPLPKGPEGGLPGAKGGASADLPRFSSGRDIPALQPPPGSPFAGASGSNAGGPGVHLGGPGSSTGGSGLHLGGPGSNTGGPGATNSGLNGTGSLPGSLTGTPGATPADGQNPGGVPFFPPMMGGMGGMGGAGEKPQERERQTWLAEDESVWGTDVAAGSGVIGRPEDEDGSEEILIASLPGQERLHPAVHRRRRRTEESEKRSAAHAEEPSGAPAQEPPQPGAQAQEQQGSQERPAESAAPATT